MTPKRWAAIITTVVGVLIAAVAVLATSGSGGHSKIDTVQLNADIEKWMRSHLGSTRPFVNCPDGEAATKGNEFLCSARDQTGQAHIDVTVINDNGDLRWQVIG